MNLLLSSSPCELLARRRYTDVDVLVSWA